MSACAQQTVSVSHISRERLALATLCTKPLMISCFGCRDKLWIETQRGTVEGSPGKISIRNSRKTADGIQEKCVKDNLGRTVC